MRRLAFHRESLCLYDYKECFMKTIFLTVFLFIFATAHSVCAEELFSVSSAERGISAFDFKVIEV